MKPFARRRARRLALQALYQWEIAQQPLLEIEQQFLAEEANTRAMDAPYFTELLQEVPKHLTEIQEQLIPHLDRKLDELNPVELNILRIATYELLKRLDVPYRVVLNEAIELAKEFGASEGHRFVNGVLDKLVPKLRTLEFSAQK